MGLSTTFQQKEPDDEMWSDELRIGTTWADVLSPVGEPSLQAGDADQDYDFDQADLVQVQVAAKYPTGEPATWGEGDWNAAPGGTQGDPPQGDGLFNQQDIIAALGHGLYLTGPYAGIGPAGVGNRGDVDLARVPVPEPASWALVAFGLAGLSFFGGRRPARSLGN